MKDYVIKVEELVTHRSEENIDGINLKVEEN